LPGPSFAFDVEGLELAGHVFSIAEIRPPNPPSKATVCAMTKGNIAELAAIALSRYSLFLLSIRTIGYRGEQCSGGESGIRTDGTIPLATQSGH
jgi:hypothetical protein